MNDFTPPLTEKGKKEAQLLIDRVRQEIKLVATEIIESELDNMYTDISEWIESDSWSNYRASVIRGVAGYSGLGRHESKGIRDKILAENRGELINDLNTDLADEVDRLNNVINEMQRWRS